jgi:hypothetical protein
MAVDARFADGRPLGLGVWQRANGEVCDADSLGGAGCFTSFEGAPGNVGWSSIHGHHVLTGVLRDGTTGVDLRIFGEWRPAHVSHRGVYLDFGTRNLGSAITGYRYHLAGGATVTCDRWGAC